jgi:prepilin-type N-terminal cleavage/methylation domain-containing protein
MTYAMRSKRLGFTLVELIISITVFGLLVTAALNMLARESSAFQSSVRRLVALRNANYALSRLEQDLRTAGINVPAGQPELIYLGHDVVAFTSDNVTNLADDPFAAFVDVDSPAGQVRLPTTPVVIPGTGFQFPDTVYDPTSGVESPAELLIFYFEADTATARADDFVLWRQVNHGDPERVAHNLVRHEGQAFFSYLERAEGGGLVPVPDSAIPLRHVQKVHLASSDTGNAARIDRVRGVNVRIGATNGLDGELEARIAASRLVDLPNVGYGGLGVCGDQPILDSALIAGVVTLAGGEAAIELRWSPATDESDGEKDVVRYVLWRRMVGTFEWGDPFVSIPAGAPAYVYVDKGPHMGITYEYGLAAQDCTPSLSPLAISNSTTMPVS